MNFDIKSYAKIYKNWLSDELCKNVVSDLNNSNWYRHSYSNSTTSEIKSYDTDLDVTVDLNKWIEPVHEKIWKAIEQYVVKDLNFSWYSGWTGYTQVRYNKYQVGTEMRNHCDHIHSVFDGNRKGIPVLTVLGGLNNDYEGGELVMWENEIVELKAGDVMVFPSNFLYPHKVLPITKGTRYSYVSWVW